MKILLFTGAGTSVELGVPAMRSMAEQFKNHLYDIKLPQEILQKVEQFLAIQSNDMEHMIELIDQVEGGARASSQLGEEVDEAKIIPYKVIRQEAEWFVQHSCEQVKANAAVTMWTPTLRAAANMDLTIASTNYDRAIEISSSRLRLELFDGFETFEGKEIVPWKGFNSNDNKQLRLLKLHGSTDWYHGPDLQVYKLRHPMPLYGRLGIVSESLPDVTFKSALVLPSREKKVTQPPFPDIGSEFRRFAEKADIAIFIGTSLRDPHIRDVCAKCANRIPTFVVSRSKNFPENLLPDNVVLINQNSGQFLISTLPKFLKDQDVESLKQLENSLNSGMPTVLKWLMSAFDENAHSRERCKAIEKLAAEQISLQEEEIKALLQSSSQDVSIFGLGLLQASQDKDKLLKFAKALSESSNNEEFKSELLLLEEMFS